MQRAVAEAAAAGRFPGSAGEGAWASYMWVPNVGSPATDRSGSAALALAVLPATVDAGASHDIPQSVLSSVCIILDISLTLALFLFGNSVNDYCRMWRS